MRRLVHVAVVALFLHQATGCTRQLPIPVGAYGPEDPAVSNHPERGGSVVGYTTIDGIYHPYQGRLHVGPDGSLHFEPSGTSRLAEASTGTPMVLAADQVQQVQVQEVTSFGHGVIVFGVVLAASVMAALVILLIESRSAPQSQGGSCPNVYAWDGGRFVLDGEPYGGAIARCLERDDVCELSSLLPVDDE